MTNKPKTVEDYLREFIGNFFKDDKTNKELVTQVLSQLKELVPEKHLIKGDKNQMIYWESVGYNQAIDDMNEKMFRK